MRVGRSIVWVSILAASAATRAASDAYGLDREAVQPNTLTLLWYDYAALPAWAWRNLEQRTRQIMSTVGISLDWVLCSGPARQERCSGKPERGQVVIRILARCPKDGPPTGEILGFALTPGSYVSLCADRVDRIERDNWLDRGSVMPYAAGHEIGHLLLGPAHARDGIMRALWSKADLSAMAVLRLHFSVNAAEAMRRAVSAAPPRTAAGDSVAAR